jgi:hypothetical protein
VEWWFVDTVEDRTAAQHLAHVYEVVASDV